MERIILEPVQWHRLPHIEDVEPLNDSDYSALRELGEVLERHGKTGRFGVWYAIHKPHLPSGGATVCRGICGEQYHGSNAS